MWNLTLEVKCIEQQMIPEVLKGRKSPSVIILLKDEYTTVEPMTIIWFILQLCSSEFYLSVSCLRNPEDKHLLWSSPVVTLQVSGPEPWAGRIDVYDLLSDVPFVGPCSPQDENFALNQTADEWSAACGQTNQPLLYALIFISFKRRRDRKWWLHSLGKRLGSKSGKLHETWIL